MHRFFKKLFRALANHDPKYYDMYQDASESRFAQLYLSRIREHCAQAGIRPPARILDAGCQTGRLLVPLAREGYQLTGIDTSGFALRRAGVTLKKNGAKATLIRGNIGKVLGPQHHQRYDVVICAEVLYLCQDFRTILKALAASLRPGGLLCISHRPQAYYLIEALRSKNQKAAEFVLTHPEGSVHGGSYFNWHTDEEVRSLYEELGFKSLSLYPIDRFAWLGGLDVGRLDERTHAEWLKLELSSKSEGGTCARYLFVVATTSSSSCGVSPELDPLQSMASPA